MTLLTPLATSLGLPLDQPVLVFAIAMGVFLIGPLLAKRLGQPGIVGVVLFGALIGPGILGIVDQTDAIVLLGEVGLIYLLFTVGLELDLKGFAEAPENAALFGLTSFFLPFIGGTIVMQTVLGLDIWAALLLSSVFASHTLLAYPIVNRFGVTKNRAVTAVFGGILFTDTLALVVLAIVIGAVEGELSLLLFGEVGLSLAILFGGAWLLIPRLSRWFFQTFSEESYFEFLFVMVAIFGAASLAELLDLSPILGAFVAGLALNQLIPEGGTLMNRVEFVGNAFFIPFFLLHVGMFVDPAVIFDGTETLLIAGVVIGVMFAAKGTAAWLVARIQGYTAAERNAIFGLSIGQAAAALAITLIGFEAGLFGPAVLNAVVLMLVVTAVVSPWLTERAANQIALEREIGDGEESAKDPTILLPLSHNAELQQRLLELAFVIKDNQGIEPVHTLTVVRPDVAGETDRRIVEVTEELEDLAAAGSAAEVPVETETRVNHNVASGIVQGAVEVQADQIIMGWDATETFQHRIFGSIIDQVLKRSKLPVIISRLGHPINTTRRIFVVVPIGADHHEGFYEAVHLAKRIAMGLGAELHVLVVEGSSHQFEHLFELVEEDVTAEFDSIDSWGELLPTLHEKTDDDDLIITISPRRGDVGWHSELEDLPKRLAELPPESFITIHPRQGEPEYDRQYLRFK